jgi:hypothetical protein
MGILGCIGRLYWHWAKRDGLKWKEIDGKEIENAMG